MYTAVSWQICRLSSSRTRCEVVSLRRGEIQKIVREGFEKLVRDIEQGVSDTLKSYLKAMGMFHRYSVGNAILIHLQRPGATHVAGFRAWQRLGRHVRRGEHGIAIMAPVVYRKKPRQEKGKRDEDEVVSTFKAAYVFDISQTEGKPLPKFGRVGGDPGVYMERLERFISGKSIKLERGDLRIVDGVSIGGTILLKASLTAAEEFSVLVHELAHEMLHQDPGNRPKEKTVREAEAEAVAYVVCQGVGLDVNTASSDYIQLYNGDKKTLMRSLERIQRTAGEILEAVTDEGKDIVSVGDRSEVGAVAA
jgi:antirestriction protein ArdC